MQKKQEKLPELNTEVIISTKREHNLLLGRYGAGKNSGPTKIKAHWSAEKKARHHVKLKYKTDTEG